MDSTNDHSSDRQSHSRFDFLRSVSDHYDECPYLPEQIARMPLEMASRDLRGGDFDQMLAAGYRRSGRYFYRTQCPHCQACEPIRLGVSSFSASRSQRRVLARGRRLECRWAVPSIDQQRVDLFNLHRKSRNLDHGGPAATLVDYRLFLLSSPCETIELSLWDDKRLIAISITDLGQQALSAVYCFFDPAAGRFSPGTLAILQQVELARQRGLQWVYLGLYVERNPHLNYKARFVPHQRLIAGHWQDF